MSSAPVLADAHLTARLLGEVGPERVNIERELLDCGFPFPLPHRVAWAKDWSEGESYFFSIHGPNNDCCAGFATEVNYSRALPGHLLLRVERFGAGLDEAMAECAIHAIMCLARESRTLRINIEVFSPDTAHREMLLRVIQRHGFVRATRRRRYYRTISIDLSGDEASILASLSGSARRHIRAMAKHPVQLKPLDPSSSARASQLHAETMSRTGGRLGKINWDKLIRFCIEHPDLCRLVGLYRTDVEGPDALLAFACGHFHGSYVHYDIAASTRNTGLKIPLAYGPVWDLICWAKGNGASWFDFGGITQGHFSDEDDRLGGISDFKRHFSKTVIEVGDEWVLEPNKLRAKIAGLVSGTATWLSRIRHR